MTAEVASNWLGFDGGNDAELVKSLDLFSTGDQTFSFGLSDADFGFLLGDGLGLDVEAPGTPVPDSGLVDGSEVPQWLNTADFVEEAQPQAPVTTGAAGVADGLASKTLPAVTTGVSTRLRTTAPAPQHLVQLSDLTGTATPTSSGTNSVASSESDDYSDAPPPKKDPRIGKRKAAVDLSKITDVEERRKQRRLIKNRATAALSRERKRAQMAHLQTRVKALETENSKLTYLLSCRDAEIARMIAAGAASAAQ